MTKCVPAEPVVAAHEEVNIDMLAHRITELTEREKIVVSAYVAGQEDSLPALLGLEKKNAETYVSNVLARADIPRFLPHIRRLYLKAGGLQAAGRQQEAQALLSYIATQGQRPHGVRAPLPGGPPSQAFLKELTDATQSLRAFAISLCGNVDHADDLVQEAFTRALANHGSYTEGTKMLAWLFTILRNHFRSEYRIRRREVEDGEGRYAETLKTQPEQYGRVEFREFREALDQLPAGLREALVLVGASGFTYDEAASICGCAVGTIKSRVNRARTLLAELMAIDDFEELGPDGPTRAVLNGNG